MVFQNPLNASSLLTGMADLTLLSWLGMQTTTEPYSPAYTGTFGAYSIAGFPAVYGLSPVSVTWPPLPCKNPKTGLSTGFQISHLLSTSLAVGDFGTGLRLNLWFDTVRRIEATTAEGGFTWFNGTIRQTLMPLPTAGVYLITLSKNSPFGPIVDDCTITFRDAVTGVDLASYSVDSGYTASPLPLRLKWSDAVGANLGHSATMLKYY